MEGILRTAISVGKRLAISQQVRVGVRGALRILACEPSLGVALASVEKWQKEATVAL